MIAKKAEDQEMILESIIRKYERNYKFTCRKIIKEWRLRSVIFKMKEVAKEIKKKKKLKKKIREKIAKETLNNLKNKTAMFQSAHEFSYKIDKIDKIDKTDKKDNEKKIKNNEQKIKSRENNNNSKEGNNTIKEEDEKNDNEINWYEESEDSIE